MTVGAMSRRAVARARSSKLTASARVWGLPLAFALLLSPAPTRAHGRPLGVNQFFRVGGRDVLFTTRGPVVQGVDGVYRWSCSRAYGDTGQALVPNLAHTATGSTLAGTIAGLYRREPDACAWTRAPGALEFVFVGDVFALPVAGARVFAVTADPVPDNVVARSDDDGASFEVVSVGAARLQSVRVAPSDPSRVYAAGFVPGPTPLATPDGVVLVSQDGGVSFETVPVVLQPGELTVLVTHVSPTLPERVWLRTVSARAPDSPDERLLRLDAVLGEVSEVLSRRQVRGSAAVIGGAGEAWVISAPQADTGGLLRVDVEGRVTVVAPALDASWVLDEAGALYVAPIPRSNQTSALERSSDAGQSFVRVLGFEDIRETDGCSEADPAEANACEADLADLLRDSESLLIDPSGPEPSGGCALVAPRRGSPSGAFGLVTLLCASFGRRARRRHRKTVTGPGDGMLHPRART